MSFVTPALLLSCILCQEITDGLQTRSNNGASAGASAKYESSEFQAKHVEPLLPQQEKNTDKDKETIKLRSVVKSIDKDGDGRVTVQELAALNDRSMKAFYKQEAEHNMKGLDTNKDGKVTWDEYTKLAGSRGAQLTPEQTKRDKRRFKHTDLNEDGCLSSDELVSMYHPEQSPHMFAVIVEEFLEYVDSNSDGYLSFDEYKEKTARSSNPNQNAVRESFRRLDRDNDGKLDIEEMKLWLAALDTASQVNSQAKNLVDMADDDKDGVLNEEEIINHRELFTARGNSKPFAEKVKDEL